VNILSEMKIRDELFLNDFLVGGGKKFSATVRNPAFYEHGRTGFNFFINSYVKAVFK
jgi:hypothetical protein